MPEVATCPDAGELRQLASGDLPAAAVEALIGHVETCPSCLARVQTLTPSNTLVDSLGRARAPADGPDAEVVARLIARLKTFWPAAAADSVDDRTTEVRTDPSPAAGADDADDATDPDAAAGSDDPWAFLAPPLAADEIGRLGAYRVLAVLGRGGMGVVFRAEDPSLKRIVAVKAMLPAFAASPSAKKRFLREAQTAASIQHDHIVTIHQVGEDRGVPFLAMEFLHGEPLDARLKRTGRVPVADVLRIGREVADGLAAAHDVGLIHRDIKPANVWLESRPGRGKSRVKILDFGLARTAGDRTGLTQTGAIIGTPAYMAPEQARGKPVDGRADLWSLGVMLYEMTTGRRPFTGTDTLAVLTSLALDHPAPPHVVHPDIPAGLSDLIVRLLAKAPGDRPANAQAVADELLLVQTAIAVPVVEPLPAAAPADTLVVDPWARIDEAGNVTPGPTAVVIPRARPARRPLLYGLLAGLLLVAGGFGAYQLVFKSKDGTLTVEVDGDADLRFKNGKLELYGDDGLLKYTIAASEKNTTLPPGKYLVKITDGAGLKVESPEFVLEKGGKAVVRVRAEPAAVGVAPADPPPAVPGPGFALDFNGTDSRVEVAELHPPAAGPVTIELWARPAGMTDKGTVFEVVGDGRMLKLYHLGRAWAGDAWSADKAALEYRDAPAKGVGRWAHLALCWDGQTPTMFVDGVKVATAVKVHPCPRPESRPALLGCMTLFAGKHTEFFRGSVSEVRVSKAVRYTQDFTPRARFAPDADTVALYHCDEGGGDKLTDSSGNGFDGKIVGAKWVPAHAPSATPDEVAAAEWVLGKDGFVTVRLAGKDVVVNKARRGTDADRLPKGPYTIVGVNLSPSNAETLPVSDADMRRLACLKQLEALDLGGQPISTAGLANFAGCTGLKLLKLYATRVDAQAIATVSRFNRLETFMFPGVEAGPADRWAEALTKLPAVRDVHAYRCDLTDAGVAHLARLPNLDTLTLSDIDLTDASLKALAGCRSLRTLAIDGSPKMTPGEVRRLKQSLPECQITHNGKPVLAPADLALEFAKGSLVQVPTLKYDGGPLTVELTIHPTKDTFSSVALIGTSKVMFWGAAGQHGVSLDLGDRTLVAFVPGRPVAVGKTIRTACVFDGRKLTYFVDGKAAAGRTDVPGEAKRQPGGTIGGHVTSSFLGRIDELRVSKVARYAGDYAPARRFVADADTVALYHFDEGAGDHLADASGNGHHGKITGAKWVTTDGAADPPDPDRAVVEWVLKVGGTVGVQTPAGFVETSRANQIPAGPIAVKGVNVGEKIGVTDADLRLLADLRGLDTIVISRTGVTDKGIATLAALPKLDALYASGLPLTDTGIEPLKRLSLLKLHLGETNVTDAALPVLGGFDRLDDLNLDRCSITDAGLDTLAKSAALRRLVLTRARVTAAGVKKLAAALPKCRIEWDGGAIEPTAK